jgi:predicted metal-binding membrane protein
MLAAKPRTAIGPVEKLVLRDQRIVGFATLLIVLLAGLYTFFGVGTDMSALDMTRMSAPIGEPMEMAVQSGWTVSYAVLMFAMWWIMMVAMMTPSAAPMLLLYTALKRVGPEGDRAVFLSFLFLCGYLAMWALFSVIATGLQGAAELSGLSNGPMMTISSQALAAIIFVAAGMYQLSGIKNSCLRHCKSPTHFLAEHSRPGSWGAFRTGARHGAYCLGCCWALMALLFVGGIMNLFWIVGIALYVLIEKLVPDSRLIVRTSGIGMILVGVYLLATFLA